MKKTSRRRGLRVGALVAAFLAGVLVDSWLRVYGPPQPAEPTTPAPLAPLSPAPTTPLISAPIATTGSRLGPSGPSLKMPLEGVDMESMKGGFAERRQGHAHEAVDLQAPRNAPVHAVDEGTIARLFVSKAGGYTIYQFDPNGRLCYYYAHLERYADGLREGSAVKQGQVIGYVGTSGNAPPNTPHLHFAVFEMGADRRWWKGRALDPYLVFKGSGS